MCVSEPVCLATPLSALCSDHTPKPFGITEATGVSCVAASVDCNAQLIITLTSGGYTSRFVSKYRPAVPQVRPAPPSPVQ